MQKDLTQGNPFKTLIRFVLPIIAGNLFQLFYTLADTIIVGQTMGANALAAVGATSNVVALVLSFIEGIASGFSIIAGQHIGAKQSDDTRISIATGTVLSILFTLGITILTVGLAPVILSWLNTPANIYDMAYDYVIWIFIGTGATMFYNLYSNYLRAKGDARTPLVVLIIASVLNIVLDYVLIVYVHWGVAGAAIATVFSQFVAALSCLICGMRMYPEFRITISDIHHAKEKICHHLKIGLPMGIQLSIMAIGLIAMQGSVNALGSDAIAGFTAAAKLDQFPLTINTAFSLAISAYVAQNYGAGLTQRIRHGVWIGMMQISVLNLIMGIFVIALKGGFVSWFVNDPTAAINDYASTYFLAVAPFYILLGAINIYRSALQAYGNIKAPFLSCIVELILRTGGTILLGSWLGYIGICLATPAAWIGSVAVCVPIYLMDMRTMECGY